MRKRGSEGKNWARKGKEERREGRRKGKRYEGEEGGGNMEFGKGKGKRKRVREEEIQSPDFSHMQNGERRGTERRKKSGRGKYGGKKRRRR